ncbi:odorant receptor 4 [Manduca sexta]|uniref:Odorant receptor n=1 Tax=Manduca sexta TaxID=7130 RepID=A0A921YQY6_MANSE|nr:odorant receptor 4 [Manduca sexta]KAG6443515.1 hypothetical protein O3G_MSEX002863 [Manduca sexta]
MSNLMFDQSMSKIEILFRITGINITSKGTPNTRKNRIIYILNFILLNTDVLGAVCWFISGLLHGKNLTQLTYVAPCVTLSFLGDFKTIFLVLYEKDINQLIQNLRKMELREKTRERTDAKDAMIKKEMNFLNAVVNVSYVLNILLLVAFAINPLVLMGLKYMKTGELEFLLPFLIVYPFNAYDIKVWPMVYIRQIWSEVVVVLDVCVADFMFYIFCTHITIQFQLLQHKIEKIIDTPKNINTKILYNEHFRTKLIEIIKWHQELIWSTNLLETIYTKSTLYNFVSSSIIICLTGFNVTAINDIALVISFLTFLFMGLLQIFFLCFFGDMLMKASMDVSDAVHNSYWYLAHPRIGKHLLLVQTRAQKPCKLTASGFADVNLRAFMKILSTSWSYFALLQTLYSPPRE